MPAHRTLFAFTLPLMLVACCGQASHQQSNSDDGFRKTFDVRAGDFASTGRNDYFVLEPGFRSTFEGTEDGEKTQLIITVLNETKQIDGVETRIVEERESSDGQLKEVSRNYFAIDKNTNDVYYFGEDVDEYRDGKVASHGGSWQSGTDGAHFGLFMPAKPQPGQKFYQELAPHKAMDRCEVFHIDAKQDVPAGHFDRCVVIQETSPLEPGHKERKIYAPGAGLLMDGELQLLKYGMGKE